MDRAGWTRSDARSRWRSSSTSCLPRIDGWDVLAALKVDPETAAIPVVVVSMLDERVKGLSLGAADYLVKPVSRDDLLAALARARGDAGAARHRGAGARIEEHR